MNRLVLIALVLVGCSKSGGGGGADGDPCDAPINKAIDSMVGAAGSDTPPALKAIADKLRGIYLSSCKADKWSADVLACFNTATTQPAIKACRQKLPPEQAAHVQQQIMAVMAGAGGGGMPPGGMPPGGGGGGAPPMPPAGGGSN